VEWAAREALHHSVRLRIVSAAALLPRMFDRQEVPSPGTVTDARGQDRDRALTAAAGRAAAMAPGLRVDTGRLAGPPAQAVTRSGSGALMLVVGSRGIGAFTAMVLGSVSRYAATHASCPVVVVRDESAALHQQVGVGIGDLDNCTDALAFACEEAALRGASLTAVHAWRPRQPDFSRAGQALAAPGAAEAEAEIATQLAELLDDWRAKYPDVPISQEIVPGHPGRTLVGLSARVGLVVIGRHLRHLRHPGAPGLGAVTHAVLNHAHGPVVTVPAGLDHAPA
jgi:nucleotide-binding universal stress UspA family protein